MLLSMDFSQARFIFAKTLAKAEQLSEPCRSSLQLFSYPSSFLFALDDTVLPCWWRTSFEGCVYIVGVTQHIAGNVCAACLTAELAS